jgi:amino acid transporter
VLTNLLTSLGFSRDDGVWLWGRLVGAAAAVASGIFDLHYWFNYVGVTLSERGQHIITVVAVAILWISGKQSASHLPSKATVDATKVEQDKKTDGQDKEKP